MFDTITKPWLMGILNITPDSFSDGGRYIDATQAVQQARAMLLAGANIIDIGGESTRPGANPVSASEQIARVLPVLQALRKTLGNDFLISIDTTLANVAQVALDAGANLINDVSAGRDNRMFALVAARKAPIILMHMQGTPKTMQKNPGYSDVVAEIVAYLHRRIDAALQAGISPGHIAIDPGIGFGKRTQDNLTLLAHLTPLVHTGYAVLLGTSRKRFMGAVCAIDNPTELITATAVTTALGVMAGVKLFRVHDIPQNRQALEVAWAIKTAA